MRFKPSRRTLVMALVTISVGFVAFSVGLGVGMVQGAGYVNFQQCINARFDASALQSIRSGNSDAAIAILEARLGYTLTSFSQYRRFNDSAVIGATFRALRVPRMSTESVRRSIQPAVDYLKAHPPKICLNPLERAALDELTSEQPSGS